MTSALPVSQAGIFLGSNFSQEVSFAGRSFSPAGIFTGRKFCRQRFAGRNFSPAGTSPRRKFCRQWFLQAEIADSALEVGLKLAGIPRFSYHLSPKKVPQPFIFKNLTAKSIIFVGNNYFW
jgi:hypothetical protein